MAELRCYVFLDSLQPQYASFLGTVAQGFLPTPGEASLFVEIAPGMDIMRVTDVALKATNVKPGMLIIERLYGMLEVHSESQADVRAAGQAILDMLGLQGRRPHQARTGIEPGDPQHLAVPHAAHQPDRATAT